MINNLLDFKTFITASVISFVAWLFAKFYSFFDSKIKRIDSIEELKKEFNSFKEEYKEDNDELKNKIEKIYEKLMK